MKKYFVVLMLSIGFFTGSTQAATIYFDSSTDLYWLELTATQNQSYLTVIERITSGDLAGAGWQYATASQVDTLVTNFGGTPGPGICPEQSYCGWSVANNGVVDALLATFGDLAGVGDESISLGIHEANGGFRRHATWYDNPIHSNSETMDFIATRGGEFSLGYAQGNAGSFLVTTLQPVPVPAALWLFGSGLLGLIGISRRKKTASQLNY
jgi:hypothetical protein